jgi:O-antigen ligase
LESASWKWLLVLPLGALLWLMGRAVGLGGIPQLVALSVAGAVLITVVGGVFLAQRVGWGALALEVPVLLLLLSTLVFRQRTATDLAGTPLDLAALIRVAEVTIAGILGFFALLWGQVAPGRGTTLPFRLYALYVLVVFAGAPGSVNPPLTAYRGLELAVALIVLAGAHRSLGDRAGPRIEATLYWFCVAVLVAVWAGLLIFPNEAIARLQNDRAPVGLQLQGVYPSIAANSVGLFGVLVAAWSLGRIRSERGGPGLSRPLSFVLAGFGTISLLASQYRTGYVALAAVVAVYVLIRGKKVLGTLLIGGAIATAIWAPYATQQVEPYLLRGQTREELSELSSRTIYWRRAIPLWEESPWIGRGLLTSSRFEVLAPLGLPYTAGIHGTWPEALLGTGIIGTGLLFIAFVVTAWRALREARVRRWITPLLLMTVLGIRSITGPTFESFFLTALAFMWLMISLDDRAPRRPNPERAARTRVREFDRPRHATVPGSPT